VIWDNLHIALHRIASLEYPNISFAETMLFEVIPEDFEWDRWGVEHRFIYLCMLKETFSMSPRTDVNLAYVLCVAVLALPLPLPFALP
jgi:hypothetical protein